MYNRLVGVFNMNYPSLNETIQANDWIYVGEGNQNLIVRYTGSSQAFSGKVLRVIKSNSKTPHVDEETLLSQKDFLDRVIRPLLGEEYVLDMQPVSTSKPFLAQLAANIQLARPLSRLETMIAVDAPVSFIMADLFRMWPGIPTLTFELKPKWGFKPSSDGINKIKTQYCRYCMHSHYRNIASNGYCPMDLYSENPALINRALNVLINKAPEEKTLKVSINGNYASLIKADPDTEYKSLLKITTKESLLLKILKAVLVQDPILSRLKALQAELDEIDVEHILPLYQQASYIQANVDTFAKVVSNYKRRKLHDDDTLVTDTQRILEYVLSMTFKDCSVMINVTPENDSPKNHQCIALDNGLVFRYDIKVIDTDLKSFDKIPYWHKLDQIITNHAVETSFSKEKAC